MKPIRYPYISGLILLSCVFLSLVSLKIHTRIAKKTSTSKIMIAETTTFSSIRFMTESNIIVNPIRIQTIFFWDMLRILTYSPNKPFIEGGFNLIFKTIAQQTSSPARIGSYLFSTYDFEGNSFYTLIVG